MELVFVERHKQTFNDDFCSRSMPFLRSMKLQEEGSLHQQMIDKKKLQQTEERALIGTIAATIDGKQGKRSVLYIIGDYLYHKAGGRKTNDGSTMLDLKCSTYASLCKGRAILDPDTLKVLKLSQSHSCKRDPDLKFIIQMENEMKILAETSSASLKSIFDEVCLKNPTVAPKLEWTKMYTTMKTRRSRAKQL